MIACNFHGKPIGKVNTREELAKKYGAGTILIKRELLNKILCDKAKSYGVDIEFGKKLTNIETKTTEKYGKKSVIASFEDGIKAEGDFLVGCDGIHSSTRRIITPDSLKPTYSGVVLVGGTTKKNNIDMDISQNTIYLTYGKNAFFGNLLPELGEHMWWTYAHHPEYTEKEKEKTIKILYRGMSGRKNYYKHTKRILNLSENSSRHQKKRIFSFPFMTYRTLQYGIKDWCV